MKGKVLIVGLVQ